MQQSTKKALRRFIKLMFHPGALVLYGIIAIGFGIWGFSILPLYPKASKGFYLDYFYRSIQLFGLEWNLNIGQMPPWQLDVARYLAMFVSVASIIKAFLYATSTTLKLLVARMVPTSKHAIVVGLNDLGVGIIKEFIDRGTSVVAIDTGEDPDGKKSAMDLGAAVIQGDVGEEKTLTRAGFGNARYMVAASNLMDINIKAAMTAWKLSQGSKRNTQQGANEKEERIKCYVHVPDVNIQDVLIQLKAFTDPTDDISISVFSIYENAVRTLFAKELPAMVGYDNNRQWSDGDSKRLFMLIHGESELTETLLLQALQMFRLPDQHPNIVMAGQSKEFRARMFRHYPVLANISQGANAPVPANLEADQQTIGSIQWLEDWDWDFGRINNYDQNQDVLNIVLTHTDTIQQFSTIDVLLDHLRGFDDNAYVRAYVYLGFFRIKDDEFIHNSRLKGFGSLEDILSYDVVIGEKLDDEAKKYHQTYRKQQQLINNTIYDCNSPEKNKRPWHCLSEEYKKSTRIWREFLDYRRKMFGWDIKGFEQYDMEHCNQEFLDNHPELKAFGRMEYERWYTERRLNGWVKGDNNENRRIKDNLVKWDDADQCGSLRFDVETITLLNKGD